MLITATVTVEVNEKDWADDYGLPPEEVEADVKSYLTEMLRECSTHIELKGSVK